METDCITDCVKIKNITLFVVFVPETIVKGLNSGDEGRLKDAMQKADHFIKSQKTKTEKDEEKDLPQTTTGGMSCLIFNCSSSATVLEFDYEYDKRHQFLI